MHTAVKERWMIQGERVVKALRERRFWATYCESAQEALSCALSLIPEGGRVGWGGSVSIEEIGLLAEVRSRYQCIDRDAAHTPEERVEIMRRALLADTFLMSANAISEDGQLFNIDGNGNRLAALCYGPRSVIVVAGMNKVVQTVADAERRARTVAAPTNIRRFPGSKTPCAVTGECRDCVAEECVCAQLVRTRVCRPAERIKVILVGEPLGF